MKSVREFTNKFRKVRPEFSDLDDTDIMNMVAKKKPDLLRGVDRDDLARSMRESRKKQVSKARQKWFGSLSGYSRFMSGAGMGMLDMAMGIKQLLGGDTNSYKENKQVYLDASKGDFASGAGELAGSIVATAPIPGFTGAKLAGKVASPLLKGAVGLGTAMATGAGIGVTEFVDEDETRAKNALVGSLFGGGAYGTGKLVKKLGVKTVNALKGKYKNANIQELMDLSKKYDIPLEISDVTGKGKSTGKALEDIPIVGTGGFRAKGAEKTQKAIQKKSGTLQDDWDEAIQASLNSKAKIGRKQAKQNYNLVEKLSGGSRTTPENSIKAIDKTLKTFNKSRTPKQNPAIKYLEELKENISSGKMNYSELRATRDALGKDASDFAVNNPTASKMLGQVKKVIENDMDDAIMAQVESMTKRKGRSVAKKIEQQTFMDVNDSKKILKGKDKLDVRKAMKDEAEKQTSKGKELKKALTIAKEQYKKDVVPYKDRKIINALKSDTPDEIFDTFIKKGKGDKAENFYKLLDSKGQSALRDGLLDNAIQGATTNGVTSPAKLAGYIERMAKPKEAIFKGSDLKDLNGFAKIMRHAERYGQLNESPSNGMQLIPYLKGGALMGAGAGAMANLPATVAGALAGGGLLKLMSFMRTKGKGFSLASSEIGSKSFENKLNKILAQLPKISALTAEE